MEQSPSIRKCPLFRTEKIGDERSNEIDSTDSHSKPEEFRPVPRHAESRKVHTENDGDGENEHDTNRVEIVGCNRRFEFGIHYPEQSQTCGKRSGCGPIDEQHPVELVIIVE